MKSRALSTDFLSPVTVKRSSGRPRPIHVQDKLPIYFAGFGPEADSGEGKEIQEWLLDEDNGYQGGISFLGNDDKPLKSHSDVRYGFAGSAKPDGSSAGGLGQRNGNVQSQQENIKVPGVRELLVADQAHRGAAAGASMLPKTLYLRHHTATMESLDSVVEYDLEEEDESWLLSYNTSPTAPCLSEASFELVIDRLEKEYSRAVLMQLASCGECCPPDYLSPQQALVLDKVFRCLPAGLHVHVRGIYQYWLLKARALSPGIYGALCPLLQRLRAEIWPLLVRSPLPGVPFLARDRQTRPQRVADTQASYDFMLDQRAELEQLRTLADKCHKREKLKRQATRMWIAELPPAFLESTATKTTPQSGAAVAEDKALSAVSSSPALKQPSRRPGLRGACAYLQEDCSPTAGVVVVPSSCSDTCMIKKDTKRSCSIREVAAPARTTHRACGWCSSHRPCAVCHGCQRGFCYNCFRRRKGLGVVGWTLAIRNAEGYRCPECVPDSHTCIHRSENRSAQPVPHAADTTGYASTPGNSRETLAEVAIVSNSPQVVQSSSSFPNSNLQPELILTGTPRKDQQQQQQVGAPGPEPSMQQSLDFPGVPNPRKRVRAPLELDIAASDHRMNLQPVRSEHELGHMRTAAEQGRNDQSKVRAGGKQQMPSKVSSREVRNLINSKTVGIPPATRMVKRMAGVDRRITRTAHRRGLRTSRSR